MSISSSEPRQLTWDVSDECKARLNARYMPLLSTPCSGSLQIQLYMGLRNELGNRLWAAGMGSIWEEMTMAEGIDAE